MTLRRTGLPVALAAVALLATGCGGDKAGGGPTPFDDPSGTTPASAEPSTVTTPTAPATKSVQPTAPAGKRALVIVNPGKYRTSPAVAGFTRAIQEFYRARMAHDPGLMNNWVSTIFLTDNQTGIARAKENGLVMRPPGRIVVRSVRKGPIAGSTTVDACFGPTMSWYDTRKKHFTNDLPNGSAISMDVYNTGSLWQLYQAHLGKFSCTTVKYPAG